MMVSIDGSDELPSVRPILLLQGALCNQFYRALAQKHKARESFLTLPPTKINKHFSIPRVTSAIITNHSFNIFLNIYNPTST